MLLFYLIMQGYTENPSNEERTNFEENEEQEGDHELDHDFEDDLNWRSI